MGFGGVGDGELALTAESESTGGEERHGLINGFGCAVGCWCRERNAQIGCVFIGEGHHPSRTPGEGDGIGEFALSGGVQYGVHRWAVLAYPVGEARSEERRVGK